MLFAILCGTFGSLFTVSAEAAQAPVNTITGLDKDSAVITDTDGQTISHDTQLSAGTQYYITYNWQAPDTAKLDHTVSETFTLPDNVQVKDSAGKDMVYDGQIIGRFNIQAGSRTGTVQFNDGIADLRHRQGGFSFIVYGTKNTGGDNKAQINQTAWFMNQQSGHDPTQIDWNGAVNPVKTAWQNTVITFILSPNQTYQSISMDKGHYDNGDMTQHWNSEGPVESSAYTVETALQADASTLVTITFKQTVNYAINFNILTKPMVIDNQANLWKSKMTLTSTTLGAPTNANASLAYGTAAHVSGDQLDSIIFTKHSAADNGLLAGAQYRLETANHVPVTKDYNGNDILPQMMTTQGKEGKFELDNLLVGTYYLIETKAPTGYQLDTTPIKIVLPQGHGIGNPVLVAGKDEPNKPVQPTTGKVVLTKTTDNGETPVAGAVYALMDRQGKVLQQYTTNNYGQITVTDLAAGNYAFKEVKAPDKYTLNKEEKDFAVVAGKTTQVSVTDKMKVTPPVQPTKGQIELTKTDGQQTPLAGADYDLFDSQQKKVGSYITDQKGQITVSKLATGAYYFVETVAPAGYEKDSQRHPVTVVANQTATVTVTDQKTPSQPSVPVTPTTSTAPSIPAQTGSTSVQPVTNPTGTQTASQSANTATLPQTGEVNERIWQYVGLAVLFGELLAMGLWWQHRSKQE
ncbi:MAG: SpaA isopeptide-forming pilin-related protein [Schleiferilactobacillus perolens]|uniref:MSCRAMM family protein n=1 Tax=Schleiferilactobacillus perolens TaxID=100468 RepID=UPI0039E8828D